MTKMGRAVGEAGLGSGVAEELCSDMSLMCPLDIHVERPRQQWNI